MNPAILVNHLTVAGLIAMMLPMGFKARQFAWMVMTGSPSFAPVSANARRTSR
jgi:hypothetical protein